MDLTGQKHALFMAEFVAEAISNVRSINGSCFWICDMRIGYARVSTDDQTLDLQRDALKRAKCRQIYEEHASGKTALRPELEACLRGCLKSPANAKFTERGTGFMPAFRKLK